MRRILNLTSWFVAGLVLWALATTPRAGQAQAVNVDRTNLALQGYDPVAYFTDQRAVPGSPQFAATHEGATYRFASAAHRDAFVAEPTRFVPAYGGYCAYGVSRGYKVKVDPEAFHVANGRLYLNYDKGVQKTWLQDIPGYIAKADQNWPGLKEKPRK